MGLRDKAAEIKAAGEAERGNFEPHGAPLRVYNYWLNNSESTKAELIKAGHRRENFCHFWRVVVIWAPLLRVILSLEKFGESKFGKVVMGLVVVASIFVLFTTTGALHILLEALGVTLAVSAVVTGLMFLHAQFWNSEWNDTVSVALMYATGAIGVIALFALLVLGYLDFGFMFFVWLLGGLAAVAGTTFLGYSLAEFISGRRAIANERVRAERYAFLEEHGNFPEDEPREPGMVSKFFTALADFLILSAQIVRVKKWKICPMVDINQ